MHNQLHENSFSYWETNTFFRNIDLIVIGSGIVGLNAAITYKEQYKKSRVIVLERGILPSGASTKNAGFACFGSASELLSDLKKTHSDTVWKTVEMRVKGLEILRKRLGDKKIGYKELGGYELFKNEILFYETAEAIDHLNKKMHSVTNEKKTYSIQNKKIKDFHFKGVNGLIFNKKEGQIDTGKMMQHLMELAAEKGISILNSIVVKGIQDNLSSVSVNTLFGEFKSKHVIVATNGFANELLHLKDVKPARAQVLVTKPIAGLRFKGTFHYDEGYYYFRNIGNRVLFGGGRNLDFETETTTVAELNVKIQNRLDDMLKKIILPDTDFEIEQRWAGIMGIGSEKKPIIEKISPNVVCAVRMGGMGIAIGSLVGKLAVEELNDPCT